MSRSRVGVITRARGFTLVEAMIASLLLAVSVVGVSGTILSSYAQNAVSKQQHDAIRGAGTLMAELTALPFDAGDVADVGLTDFASYSDTTTAQQAKVSTAQTAQAKGKAPKKVKVKQKKDDKSTKSAVSAVVGLVNGLLGGVTTPSSSGTSGSGTSGSGTSGSGSGGSSSSVAATMLATSSQVEGRTVSVVREAYLNGPSTATGDLAIVTVDIAIAGQPVVHLKRLVSAAEALSSISP